MKHKTKLLAMALAAVMLFTAVSLASCDPGDLFSDTEAETTASETAESLHIEPEKSPFITVAVSPVTVAVTNNQPTLKQTLTATIQPATTENKEVDWTVAWADSTGVGDVTDYITVTPESDGSTNATVTCYKPFTGDIVITVITRDGGFTARCICNYVGKPTSLTIEPTGATMVSDSDWNIRVAEVKSGNTYLFDLLPSNVFGSTGSTFTPDYDISIQAHGGIDTHQKNYDSSGAVTGTINANVELTVADLMDTQGYCYAYFPKTGGIHVFMDVCIENNLYNNSDCNSERSKIICTDAFREVKGSGITDEAKLAALSFIVRLYYELDVSQNEFVDVSKYYRSLLAKIKIYSSSFLANWNYALDYIVFSTCIDDDYPTRNAVQKLVAAIQKIDVSKLQKEKYLKYLRLGNAIYPESTQKAGALLLQGYNLSKDYTYLHTLFGINYSTTLILEGNYNEAKAILDSIVKLGLKSQAITMSAQNNYIIAKYLSKQNDVSVYIEQMSKFCITPHQSDYCICINNYISLKIMSGTKELHNEIKMCYEIINNNDQYHSFYARHNLVVIYFLINDVRFWDCIKDLSTPYLLNYYEPLFFEKINFLKNNFEKVWNINELTTALSKNLRENGFYDTSHFNSLPVLFGLIERWFE